ncbi:MAG: hypothetical protein IPJ33_03760 [Gammaproteobacteria bacterium]|jgi:hypothetical protein|nr:hypothetical protein [Gammaproteobacteria bacterium]MBP6053039.1 hypothetical protein [Pseudomonadales bacterium]MBK6583552.1 hypothetical protein [Gammaproteobacteria bacterium]MBK7169549.1 hypothetical protein [Gammaproteobacteria bacterium]MBK7521890.1 hypothetical protein [Gammaproteobacteria bacterium]
MSGPRAAPRRQRGVVTLLLSLIMLLLISVMLTAASTLSTVNLHGVRNMQLREEALAAANMAIEAQLGLPFTDRPAPVDDFPIDIDQDGGADYHVAIATPVCVRATPAVAESVSSVTLAGISTPFAWQTIWELDASVTETGSGASIRVRQGVRVLLTQARKDAVCA